MLRRWFFTGLVVLVPVVITIYVVIGLFNFADSILGKYINRYIFLYFGYKIPGLGIIFSVLIIVLVGIISSFLRWRIFKRLELLILKFPLVGRIYAPTKEIVRFLFSPSKPSFKRVVLVEFPKEGIYSLAFITGKSSKINQKTGKKMISIFIPSSPSPLTGFTYFISEDKLIYLDISVEEAVKIIVSGGMLSSSENFSQK
ncbi:MAG TPA: DUF502 domain-containing protein [Candidatus Omnitrophica bacterium]|nr:MAG: hypothetical protein DRP61_02795 [Candidatus Omnitrophota bacterium]RKY35562.1 MAG: hypothetical protein DRP69_01165 [Candidatus Omnitrophota bacterium]RKY44464.1 MAG: hypothetical protein DRP80_02140 [Candidatus Omnitrophota bacterium]HEC69211.1 DUF502 domain-containing protein [Candidatus Omnitrophota bacterium]